MPLPNIPFNSAEGSDRDLYALLKKMGLAVPDTEEELDHLLHLLEDQRIAIPDDLPTPKEILAHGFIIMQTPLDESMDPSIEEELQQAAREGGDISADVRKRMEEDRNKSEDEQDDEQSDRLPNH